MVVATALSAGGGIVGDPRVTLGDPRKRVPTGMPHLSHKELQSGERRYLSEGSMAQLKPTSDTGGIATIDSGGSAPRYLTAQPAS